MIRKTLLIYGTGHLTAILQEYPNSMDENGIWVKRLKIQLTDDLLKDYKIIDREENTVTRTYQVEKIIPLNISPDMPVSICLTGFDGEDTALTNRLYPDLMKTIDNLQNRLNVYIQLVNTMEDELKINELRFQDRLKNMKKAYDALNVMPIKRGEDMQSEENLEQLPNG